MKISKKKNKQSESIIDRLKNTYKLLAVPHAKNEYRPHLIRGYGLVAIVFLAVGLQFGYNGVASGSVLGDKTDITINSLLEATNKIRSDNSKSELTLSAKLNKAANLKAQDMFADQYWSHNAPDGTLPWKWLGDVGYDYSEAGENLAMNYSLTANVMKAWMNSPEHRENVLKDSYQEVGFSIVSGTLNNKPTTIIVALYAVPAQVAGANTQKVFTEATPSSRNGIVASMISVFQFVTPAAMASLALLAFAVIVSASAHTYRDKLPKKLRKSWRKHHGLFKIIGLVIFGLAILLLYNSGQI
ncbi:hypothetical protein CVV43_01095 [Candidatus Saccharibacteria bacterium HGW-Saccharibacteria-1]|jgi:hypothetical protein|nr:MAG: hypothetical protein CVV43_01095 [Candidatus Saccharibacteria bacterium HGW-Saccharibacteria-1]